MNSKPIPHHHLDDHVLCSLIFPCDNLEKTTLDPNPAYSSRDDNSGFKKKGNPQFLNICIFWESCCNTLELKLSKSSIRSERAMYQRWYFSHAFFLELLKSKDQVHGNTCSSAAKWAFWETCTLILEAAVKKDFCQSITKNRLTGELLSDFHTPICHLCLM